MVAPSLPADRRLYLSMLPIPDPSSAGLIRRWVASTTRPCGRDRTSCEAAPGGGRSGNGRGSRSRGGCTQERRRCGSVHLAPAPCRAHGRLVCPRARTCYELRPSVWPRPTELSLQALPQPGEELDPGRCANPHLLRTAEPGCGGLFRSLESDCAAASAPRSSLQMFGLDEYDFARLRDLLWRSADRGFREADLRQSRCHQAPPARSRVPPVASRACRVGCCPLRPSLGAAVPGLRSSRPSRAARLRAEGFRPRCSAGSRRRCFELRAAGRR